MAGDRLWLELKVGDPDNPDEGIVVERIWEPRLVHELEWTLASNAMKERADNTEVK